MRKKMIVVDGERFCIPATEANLEAHLASMEALVPMLDSFPTSNRILFMKDLARCKKAVEKLRKRAVAVS